MYLVLGLGEDIAFKMISATESDGNPFGTLYIYFLYILENLDDFFSIRLSSFGFDTVLIFVLTKPGLIVITLSLAGNRLANNSLANSDWFVLNRSQDRRELKSNDADSTFQIVEIKETKTNSVVKRDEAP
jgi:hypothetical protein